jgi:epoxyqueuosine reductase
VKNGKPLVPLEMDVAETATLLKARAAELGFSHSGIAPAVDAQGFSQLAEWIERGYAGEMSYFPERLDAYRHPKGVLANSRTLLVFAFPYHLPLAPQENSTRDSQGAVPSLAAGGYGKVAAYAAGRADYHDLLHTRLKELRRLLLNRHPNAEARGVVDTAPLLEREFAQLAGLGWIGKNTLLLNRSSGSYFFLAVLLTSLDLPLDQPISVDHCGTCRACLDACPTRAFVAPRLLDATRCISYLTIEHRGGIPVELRQPLGEWVFGCDVCQTVCPWNRKAPSVAIAELQPCPDLNPLALRELFFLDDAAFRKRFHGTPLWRPRRRGLLRNAAIVLGNQRQADSLPALSRGLNDIEPLIRGSSAWGIGQIGGSTALQLLQQRLLVEEDPTVRREIEAMVQR